MHQGVLIAIVLALLASSWVRAGHDFHSHAGADTHPADLATVDFDCADGVCQVCAALGSVCVAYSFELFASGSQIFLPQPRCPVFARSDPFLPQDDPPPR